MFLKGQGHRLLRSLQNTNGWKYYISEHAYMALLTA